MGADDDATLRPAAGAPDGGTRFATGGVVGGRYRIERFVATGGMGEVYAAHDQVLDATIALKTLRPELEGSATAIARLRREIALARNVTNPHVCRLHDVGEHAGRVFLTMELLDGRTLADIVKQRGALPIAEVERVIAQLVDGLAALHRASIIHRDFKTSNVIVVEVGAASRAVITDFGLARSADDGDKRLTLESSLLGTPAYMSPEQVETRPTTTASDIYSFGVVVFELLTGKLPFDDDTPMATATARLHRDPPKPSALRSDVPARWDAIVARCLQRAPAARFARIEDVLGRVPVSRRWFLAAGGGAAVAATAGVGAWRYGACTGSNPIGRPIAAEDVIAVLPVAADDGNGPLAEDPLRVALTMDIHDALGTAGVPMLRLNGAMMDTTLTGLAVRLAAEPDPITAVLELRGVAQVMTMAIVERTADRIVIDVAGTGEIDYGQRFERPVGQAAALVHDIATAIAGQVGYPRPRPPRDEATATAERYAEYGRALSDMWRDLKPAAPNIEIRDDQRHERLVALATAAPDLVRATTRLADDIVARAERVADFPKQLVMLDGATALVDRALAIDPDNALAHAVRGHIAMLKWEWKLADESTRRALELSPAHQRIEYHREMVLLMLGRFDETIAVAEAHHVSDPRVGDGMLGWHYYYARRWPDVIRVVEPVLDKFDVTNWVEGACASSLAQAYAEMARFDDALRVTETLRAKGLDDYSLSWLVMVYAMAGKIDEARALRDRLYASVDLGQRSLMDDILGDREAALKAIETIVDTHNLYAIFLKIEQYTPQLRSDPRFQALLRRVGFV
jgi:tetratricopeptide (TPR) repeat protein